MEQLVARLSYARSQEALAKIDTELGIIFGGCGKDVILKEVNQRYGVTPIDAIERPTAFRSALYSYLGDLGSHMVMGRINKRVFGTIEPNGSRPEP